MPHRARTELTGAMHPPSRLMRDGVALLLAGLAVLAWDASGLDTSVSRAFGSADGFAWRDAALARGAHAGGRWLGLVMLLVLAFDAWRPLWPGPSRARRAAWWAVMAASALLVPAIKQFSLTSCPWDLAGFGGSASYVSHWLIGVADGGPGHCFPSGHAVSAFALIGAVFLWRDHSPRLAQGLVILIAVLGTVHGLVQTARGAHFVSHTLWTGWLCAALALLASAVEMGLAADRQRRSPLAAEGR